MSYDRSVYLSYINIKEHAYRLKVKYVLEHVSEIDQLDLRDKNFIKIDFLLSLFEIGDYERYLEFVDEQIESVINNNVYTFKSRDIYYELLKKKNLSFFHSYRDQESIELTKVLKRMNPNDAVSKILLRKLYRRKKRLWSSQLNGLAIFLILLTTGILFVELILVRPLYPEYSSRVEMMRNVTILSSFFVLFLNQFFVFILSEREAKRIN